MVNFFHMTLVAIVQCVILIMNMPVTTDLRDLRNFCVHSTARLCENWMMTIKRSLAIFCCFCPSLFEAFGFWFLLGTNVPEGWFVATISSTVAFVQDFKQFFKCPSNNGRCKGMFPILWVCCCNHVRLLRATNKPFVFYTVCKVHLTCLQCINIFVTLWLLLVL